MAIRESLG